MSSIQNANNLQERVAGAATMTASAGTAAVGGATGNDLLVLVGITVPIISMIGGWAISIWYKHQHLKIAQQRLHRDMRQPKGEDGGDDGGDE